MRDPPTSVVEGNDAVNEKMTVDTFSLPPVLRESVIRYARKRGWSKARAIRHALYGLLGMDDPETD